MIWLLLEISGSLAELSWAMAVLKNNTRYQNEKELALADRVAIRHVMPQMDATRCYRKMLELERQQSYEGYNLQIESSCRENLSSSSSPLAYPRLSLSRLVSRAFFSCLRISLPSHASVSAVGLWQCKTARTLLLNHHWLAGWKCPGWLAEYEAILRVGSDDWRDHVILVKA